MKQLLLIRHAKTEQGPFMKDNERKLTDRGHSDCQLMGNRLLQHGFIADKLLVSSAMRTLQTVQNLKEFLNWQEHQLLVSNKLYLASSEFMLNMIAETANEYKSIALIAHNPGITDLFNFLGNDTIDNLPTCGMALFAFDIHSWDLIKKNRGKCLWYSWPKLFSSDL